MIFAEQLPPDNTRLLANWRGVWVRSLLLVALLFLVGCAGPAIVKNRETTLALPAPADSELVGILPGLDERSSDLTTYAFLQDGIDAFAARATLAHFAQRSIDAQYYFVREDLAGSLFTALLVEAANRGVRVRLLIDDMYLHGKEERLTALALHPNISIRGFNTFYRGGCCRTLQFITRFGKVTRRMHNKSFTADNTLTIVGGRNIGDEYFGADENLVFADLDILAQGPVVGQTSESFDAYWNHELAIPIEVLSNRQISDEEAERIQNESVGVIENIQDSAYHSALVHSNFIRDVESGEIHTNTSPSRLVADSPDKLIQNREDSGQYFRAELGKAISSATDSLTIVSPYFVPGKNGTLQLAALAEKGVRVRVITNSMASNNSSLVHAHYAKRRKKLLRAGVELYETKPIFEGDAESSSAAILYKPKISFVLHAKAFVIDRDTVFVGSFNFDPRSLFENTEMGVFVESPYLAEIVEDSIDAKLPEATYRLSLYPRVNGSSAIRWEDRTEDEKQLHTHDPETGFFGRLGSRILRWLPVESQL